MWSVTGLKVCRYNNINGTQLYTWNFYLQIQSSNDDGDTEVVSCDYLVNAGGPWAAELALLAGIGQPDHENQIMREKLPVEPRLRSVFVFKCPSGPANCPLVVDGSIYWRREGSGVFLAGLTPAKVSGHCH